MGSSLDTPAKCIICRELTRNPVTLKCRHRFCQRCLSDFWSAGSGPYRCPYSTCGSVYQRLPFEVPARTLVTASTSSNTESNSSNSTLTRPSLFRQVCGKRKASVAVLEQTGTKRSRVEFPCEISDAEPATTSLSDNSGQSTDAEPSSKDKSPESEHAGNTPSSHGSDAVSDVPQVISNQHEPEEFITVIESDSSDEVDICDSAVLVTPKKGRQITASDANSGSSSSVSSPEKDQPPVNKASPTVKHSGDTSGYLRNVGIFLKPTSKDTNPVLCHYCPSTVQQIAVKTCLVCGASMCAEHLRPHLDSPVFQSHTLVSPLEDLSLWKCQEHQEMNRIYCRQCATCVCTVCTVIGSHRDHLCISIKEAERELRGSLKDKIKQLQEEEHQTMQRMAEFTQMKKNSQVVLNDSRARVLQQYGAIKEALEQEEQSAVRCVTEEEKRVLGRLGDKLEHLQKALSSIQHGLHNLEELADAKGDKQIRDQAFLIEYSKITAIDVGGCSLQWDPLDEVDQDRLKCLQRWTEKRLDTVVISEPGKDRDLCRLLYGIIPSLDPNSAHPKLLLSDNNRSVTYTEAQQPYMEHEARFSSFPQVLGSRALKEGSWYWEVIVSADEGRWKVGLCESEMERKGQKDSARLGFNVHSWCLACAKRKMEALHNKISVPVVAEGLQRVGVFLEFDEGVLSFFHVTPGGSLVLLHCYKHRFTEPLYPAWSISKTHLAICDLFQL
ncbi:E3 ubiquitin/ISG15 ligase TRIM25 [Thalassophryne amazonica]|uniref:E3 ubiquitin/ISG15 ligase TRIM25 n=1 Tax=Thalassophryne amazonica TaxID=390379 RepID=UPI0014716ADC|nr:E3 ubiquitin/ISG15 ligase TRIM25 [Thalassophryne amazonica]